MLKAAEQGHSGARYDLANIYYHGEVVPKDVNKAVKILRELAQEGDRDAIETLQQIGY